MLNIDLKFVKKPQNLLGLFVSLLITFTSITKTIAAEEELEERLYERMSDFVLEAATENLLVALETKEDGKKHKWSKSRYSGYIIPIETFINEQGYFCRAYVEVLIRDSEYNIYENKACRDHDGSWLWIETTSANKSEGRKKTLADLFKNKKQ